MTHDLVAYTQYTEAAMLAFVMQWFVPCPFVLFAAAMAINGEAAFN
jgi:hypothetical protein